MIKRQSASLSALSIQYSPDLYLYHLWCAFGTIRDVLSASRFLLRPHLNHNFCSSRTHITYMNCAILSAPHKPWDDIWVTLYLRHYPFIFFLNLCLFIHLCHEMEFCDQNNVENRISITTFGAPSRHYKPQERSLFSFFFPFFLFPSSFFFIFVVRCVVMVINLNGVF